MAVVATLNILTKVSTDQLTAGFKKANASVHSFGKSVMSLGSIMKAGAAFGAIGMAVAAVAKAFRSVYHWLKESMIELAKSDRGAYSAIKAWDDVNKQFKQLGMTIAKYVAPYMELAANWLGKIMGNAKEALKEITGFQNAGEVVDLLAKNLANAAQVITMGFQSAGVALLTVIKAIPMLLEQLAKLDKLLPKNMQLGISDVANAMKLDIDAALNTTKDALDKNMRDWQSGNTWGKTLMDKIAEMRAAAAAAGPIVKQGEPAAAMIRGSKEAYSASLKADRIVEADKQTKALRKIEDAVKELNPILKAVRDGVRDPKILALAANF
jgi:hypothetical protein